MNNRIHKEMAKAILCTKLHSMWGCKYIRAGVTNPGPWPLWNQATQVASEHPCTCSSICEHRARAAPSVQAAGACTHIWSFICLRGRWMCLMLMQMEMHSRADPASTEPSTALPPPPSVYKVGKVGDHCISMKKCYIVCFMHEFLAFYNTYNRKLSIPIF